MSISLLAAARYRAALLAAAHSQFSHSHTLGDENVRKSPKNPGNLRVSAILTGGEKPGGVRKPLASDSHDSHTDENTVRIPEKAPDAGVMAELRRRALALAMVARAEALEGIVAAARAEEGGPLEAPDP